MTTGTPGALLLPATNPPPPPPPQALSAAAAANASVNLTTFIYFLRSSGGNDRRSALPDNQAAGVPLLVRAKSEPLAVAMQPLRSCHSRPIPVYLQV
jgi:hypothetical protein